MIVWSVLSVYLSEQTKFLLSIFKDNGDHYLAGERGEPEMEMDGIWKTERVMGNLEAKYYNVLERSHNSIQLPQ